MSGCRRYPRKPVLRFIIADEMGNGFVPAFTGPVCWPVGNCCFTPGDFNSDFTVSVGDAVAAIAYIFKGGESPACYDRGDANGNGFIDVSDAVYVINYIFKGGPAPACP